MDQKNITSNPDHEDEKRLAGVLSTLIWASWGVFLFVIITALFYDDRKLIVVTMAASAMLSVPFILVKRSQLHASSLILMLLMLGTVTLIATVGQGIRDFAIVSFPILFIFAGLTLNRTFFRLCVGLTLVAVCWLVFGEFFGWFTTQPFVGGMTNWIYLIGVTLLLLVAALAVDLLASNMRRNIQQARTEAAQRKQVENEVLQLNASLEQRVAERTRELQEAQEKIMRQEKLAVLGQMAGSVGHELRNPMGVINSAIYYLKLVQPEADDKVKKHLAMIEQEVHNAEMIIHDLLDFARGVTADRELVSIPVLVKSVLDRFPPPASVEVMDNQPADLPKVFADPRQIELVLGNLMVNAYQAMPKGGQLSITSKKSFVKKAPFVCITLKDAGTGIAPENMVKLFEPLFTTKTKGIGLGLAISKKYIDANKGRIEVQSEPGQGSTFTVYLPIQKE